ncbi:MAG: hypothetical protein QF713_04220 [Dehalococcoidales bacterium]|nr:hypothetical protein [Dehalococcoidales bacterium]
MRIIGIPGHVPQTSQRISTDAVRQALERAGITYLVTIPETPYETLLRDLLHDSSIEIVQVCRESEGMGICSGLTYGSKRAALLCSFKGLYNSIDSLLGVALRTEASFLLLISEAGTSAAAASDPERGQHSAALLKALEIPFSEVESTEGLSRIDEAVAQTENGTQPVAVILHW